MSTIESLPYVPDFTTHYQALSNLPGFVILESSDKRYGRYDIVAAYPYDRLVIPYGAMDVNQAEVMVKQLLPERDAIGDLPFQGGAIGYFSYEFGAKKVGVTCLNNASFRDMPLVDLRFYDWAIVVDHHNKTVQLVNADSKPETTAIVSEIKARWQKTHNGSADIFLHSFQANMSKRYYEEAFSAIHGDIQRGRAYQVNFTQGFEAPFRGSAWEVFKRIRKTNPVPFSAYMRGDWGDIISFSPERFLLYDAGTLLTSPIKGTIKRSDDSKTDALWRDTLQHCPKNRAENVMIVDLMRNDFGKIAAVGSVSVPSLYEIQSFCGVHHLVSDVSAQVNKDITAVDAFVSCFPGGSITGAPKRESMHMIAEQELAARGVYCGSIGYFSAHGRSDSNIAIRTLLAIDSTLHVAAGGGIVMDSNCEAEYEECFTKISAITEAIKTR